MLSIKITLGESAEDADGNSSDYQCTNESLEKYRVLDLAKSGLLDPHFTIENFPNEITFLVFRNPGFIFIAVSAPHSIKRAFAHVER